MTVQNIASAKVRDQLKSKGVQSPLQQKQAIASGTAENIKSSVIGSVKFEEDQHSSTGGKSFKKVGWVHPDSSPLPEEYLIKITSSGLNPPTMVVAMMQEKVGFQVTSDWEPFIPIGGLTQMANAATQLATGKSLVSRFTSRRIWKGTSPVKISLGLKFESVENTYTDVVAPVLALMQMALPFSGDRIRIGNVSLPLLAPPGPDPFRLSGSGEIQKVVRKAGTGTAKVLTQAGVRGKEAGGDWIDVQIGKYLKFSSVIIQSVSPVFDTRLSADGGYPISAEVNVNIETYEIMTKEALADSFTRMG